MLYLWTGLGYLANVPPSEFQQFYEENLPVVMLGSEFLSSYGSHVDTATEIQEQVLYPVRQATLHPIYENFRVQTFRQTLLGRSSEQAKLMGELMFQVSLRINSVLQISSKTPAVAHNMTRTRKRLFLCEVVHSCYT